MTKIGVCVDASCRGNPGPVEYQGVDLQTGKVLFHSGPYKDGTNNIGEFLALVHALALHKKECWNKPIYTDSNIAISWIKKKRCGSTMMETPNNDMLFDLVARALKWLKGNHFDSDIVQKWETRRWGEIPADFGRKQ